MLFISLIKWVLHPAVGRCAYASDAARLRDISLFLCKPSRTAEGREFARILSQGGSRGDFRGFSGSGKPERTVGNIQNDVIRSRHRASQREAVRGGEKFTAPEL